MVNEITLAGNLIKIINDSRQNALRKVNEELIQMYWNVGEYLSKYSNQASYGDAYIDAISKEIQDEFVFPLLTPINSNKISAFGDWHRNLSLIPDIASLYDILPL